VTGYGSRRRRPPRPAAAAALLFLPARRPTGTGSCRRRRPRGGTGRAPWTARLYAVSLIILIVVLALLDQLGLARTSPSSTRRSLKSDPPTSPPHLFLFLGSGTRGHRDRRPAGGPFGHRRFLFGSFVLQIPRLPVPRATGGPSSRWPPAGGDDRLHLLRHHRDGAGTVPEADGHRVGCDRGFAIGTGGVGVTLLGAVADRYGVPSATHLVNLLPALGVVLRPAPAPSVENRAERVEKIVSPAIRSPNQRILSIP